MTIENACITGGPCVKDKGELICSVLWAKTAGMELHNYLKSGSLLVLLESLKNSK